ncbi:hypothetical protein HYX16_02595 [Candidatus Woesearchaeota archaeon]|nr:hypothetical protein [Candidatus Woesearchaeota archaeon]
MNLEELPVLNEGEHSELLPHIWFYTGEMIKDINKMTRTCKFPGNLYGDCEKREFVDKDKPFENASGYCRLRSIIWAKFRGTFNKDYKWG